MYLYMYVPMYVCMYVCLYVQHYIHTYIRIQAHTCTIHITYTAYCTCVQKHVTYDTHHIHTSQVLIDQTMQEYDLVEEYYYPLSDEDFDNRCVLHLICMYVCTQMFTIFYICILRQSFVVGKEYFLTSWMYLVHIWKQ